MVETVTLELVNNRLDEAVREMQYSIFRTGYSTIIRESKDTSAGITTKDGRVIGQKSRHTIHLGVFQPTIAAIRDRFGEQDINPGDVFLVNDPYIGGSPHSPDFIIATPVFVEGKLVAFTLNIAHKPDIGGLVPGTSSGEARELYHEGIQIPPVKFEKGGKRSEDIEQIIRNNSRIPDVTMGDVRGQVGCTKVGRRKVEDIFAEYGTETVLECFEELIDSTRQRVQNELEDWSQSMASDEVIMEIPEDQDVWEGDLEAEEEVKLDLTVENTEEKLVFDFTESADQVEQPANIRPGLVRAVCYYGVIGLTNRDIPINNGIEDVVEIRLRDGSILKPRRPAPVNQYVYTLEMLTRLVLGALSKLNPDKALADDGGLGAVTFGGGSGDDENDFVQYEIQCASYGGSQRGDGATGVSTHTMNIDITPIEILESEFPNRVGKFDVILDSEGAGEQRGGFGVRREYAPKTNLQFTYRANSSNIYPPRGQFGGQTAEEMKCFVTQDGETVRLPTIANTRQLTDGDRVEIELPGGGGFGDPEDRDPEAVLEDYQNGYISAEKAREVYGVEIDTEQNEIGSLLR